jgi:myo-inositol 2-dehydrogenase/D-chiro-inositol 1-dehydrogenase
MAGFSRRLDTSYRTAHSKIHNDEAIGTPFLIRSQTCDLLDNTGFFVRYAAKIGGMFVDCCIHDIDLSLWFFGPEPMIPKAVWAVGTIAHHLELAALKDVDNGVGLWSFGAGRLRISIARGLWRMSMMSVWRSQVRKARLWLISC